ncbi:phage regulatory CII family protein [Magnetospirillum aberrantis]|uniref:Uncharacterized protein n=1 Tax=Magnetospirillum aberrantis SpK TaxID=908842 RepID=A0A7C9QTW6_9PROT|nr:phage regulatory CII family protein [Magnetospirillum aberrantis]NFV80021.1 hypothetical protein [Magnetospirillum aberrantis SpK]
MTDRKYGDESYLSLKALTRRLVGQCGGAEKAALDTRAAESTINGFGNVFHAQFVPVDVLADLECSAGQPTVTRELARLMGYDLVPMDGGAAPAPSDPAQMVVRASRDVGTFADAVERMDADGIREPGEIDVCIERASDMMQRLGHTIDTLRRYRATMPARVRV